MRKGLAVVNVAIGLLVCFYHIQIMSAFGDTLGILGRVDGIFAMSFLLFLLGAGIFAVGVSMLCTKKGRIALSVVSLVISAIIIIFTIVSMILLGTGLIGEFLESLGYPQIIFLLVGVVQIVLAICVLVVKKPNGQQYGQSQHHAGQQYSSLQSQQYTAQPISPTQTKMEFLKYLKDNGLITDKEYKAKAMDELSK